MKVLFVASANKGHINAIVINQGVSLVEEGIEVRYYGIEGKGFFGYLGNISKLKGQIHSFEPDLIHAHFSYSGFVASLAVKKVPVVVSLMGSDLAGGGIRQLAGGWTRCLAAFFSRFVWDITIVKSGWMSERTGGQRTIVIPNGVDMERFSPMCNRPALKKKHGFSAGKKHILFFADPARYEKNFKLAQKSMEFISRDDVELMSMHGVSPELMPELINAADVVLLTSRWEGSPNIVKEAMACNCPVVATDVGDLKWLFGDEPGYYLSWPDPAEVAQNIQRAIDLREQKVVLNGRRRIMKLELDSANIARRIIAEYVRLLKGMERPGNQTTTGQ